MCNLFRAGGDNLDQILDNVADRKVNFQVHCGPALAAFSQWVNFEWFDGSGYPEHLMKNDIPLASRIISVADSFDAMTSKRSYRKAISHEEAIEELKKGINIQLPGRNPRYICILSTEEYKFCYHFFFFKMKSLQFGVG